MMNQKRRSFIKTLGITTGGMILGAPLVMAKPKLKWKMVTTWPKNFPGVGTGANTLAKNIEELTDGQISVKVYGAGELVPALGVFDAVSRGTAQMGHGASYYWKGKHEATQFFSAVPFGLTATEMGGWLRYGGGQKLWDQLYAPFNLVPMVAGNTGVQMGGWYKKPIKSIKDFKGLKIRMPGLGGEVMRRAGATVVTLPGGEIFQSLKSGAIDASEWVGPYNDLAFGFYKAAKHYYWPGWHEPGTTLECMINKSAYESLTPSLKAAVRIACQAATDEMISEFSSRNSIALNTLQSKHRVQVLPFPDSVLQSLGKHSQDVVSEIAKKDPLSKKIYHSFLEFRKRAMAYSAVSEVGYAHARERAIR